MNQPPQTSKRIVSKGEYAVMKTFALGLSGCAFACGLAMLLLLSKVPYSAQISAAWEKAGNEETNGEYFTLTSNDALLFILILLVLLIFLVFLLQHQSQKKWDAVNSTQPITRANTVDLPAPDTLVRASMGSAQEQAVVLLRATVQSEEKHEEQLLRPAE